MLYVWFSAIGSLLIVLGLYSVLWGKNKEIAKKDVAEDTEEKEKEAKNNGVGLHTIMVSSNVRDDFAA